MQMPIANAPEVQKSEQNRTESGGRGMKCFDVKDFLSAPRTTKAF
jgi:hypothetical protein